MSDPNYPSFQVCAPEDWTESSIIGRNCGTELKVGMIFDRISSVIVVTEDNAVFSKDHKFEADDVRLAIEGIEAYGNSLDTLSSGMTARLHLNGYGMARLREFEANRAKEKHYHLETELA